MPPTLDLTKPYTHADMLLSSRNSPRISLRRAATYKNDHGPLSSTSSRFSFNHLISTPPASPSLPALIPRHGKPAPSHIPRKYVRGLFWLVGVLLILYYGLSRMRLDRQVRAVGWATHAGDEYEMVGEAELPDFPTPVVITDKRGRAKWTVSIPPHQEFPLQPEQYAEICQQNMQVAIHVEDLHNHKHRHPHYDYDHVDPYFMDVAEAEAHGLLPGSRATATMTQDGFIIGEKTDGWMELDVCEKSMTFLLETGDAGLGKTLMMLWTAYGLAKKEKRKFFIDDSRWAYGKYTTFFRPPPIPNCRPPPRHQMLPCPHHARHLVVSAATARPTFGGAFNEAYEDARKMEVYRQKPIFELARTGFEALFHLASGDAQSVESRIEELQMKTRHPSPDPSDGMIIGIHVRHGDRHPLEFQYNESYMPLERYTDKARELLQQRFNHSGPGGGENTMAEMHSLMVVASDDPEVYESEELSHASRAQELIRLASKKILDSTRPPPDGKRIFVDEAVGWEGGFFAAMFWSLGKPSSIPKKAGAGAMTATNAAPPTEDALRLRELLGRAYLMDLAVLGQASGAIICTVSSTGCRLLAIMMGWDRAVVEKGWVNIDGDFDWKGIAW